ncbi:phytanoyl-CoA dioxygenase family protein [Streptomyces sp. JW3]|uniref:phytanoyl-CoA dioxygenase family protein n=1 Tax=Streptomyces sp. JW3 TaxID=3456955 RepID=UPI003FA432EE
MTVVNTRSQVWLSEADCRLDDFRACVERTTDPGLCPTADGIEHEVPLYDSRRLTSLAATAEGRRELQAEINRVLSQGPGVAVFKCAFTDLSIVDRATGVFLEMIEEERASGTARGDHYAKPGTNDRVWNALEKLARTAPEVFADYYANDIVALVSAAWLGPGYQVTSQVNVVNPGAAAQRVHRDYHFGFLSNARASAFPRLTHLMAPALTLQGAVAHCDMPVESGPTLYLPHSHKYEPGHLAWRLPEFAAYFEEHRVQLPLDKGDAVFFNPALFHAAGHNSTATVRRVGNLLQVSSPFGRAMESVEREPMVNAVFPVLRQRKAEGADGQWLRNVVDCCAEGYPFPTDLDVDAPVGGLAPPTQAETVWRALEEGRSPQELAAQLRAGALNRGAGAR